MKFLSPYFLVGLAVVTAGLAQTARSQPAASGPKPPPPIANPQELVSFKPGERFLYHAGQYAPFDIRWQTNDQLRGVSGVFPHPYVAWRAYVATANGLQVTEDWGKTFQPLPQASAAGRVRQIAFVPDNPDAFFAAAEGRGIWSTLDGGKTFAQVASKASGLADDSPSQLVLYGGDAASSTLLACYGETAAGMSVSCDGGKNWYQAYGDYFIHDIISPGVGMNWMYIVGSKKDEPDVRCVYRIRGIGDKMHECARDLPAIGSAVSRVGMEDLARAICLATEGKGLQWAMEPFDIYKMGAPRKFFPIDGSPSEKLLNIGTTYGSTADSELVYAYEPSKLGLAVAQRQKKVTPPAPQPAGEEGAPRALPREKLEFASFARGLYTGTFVKEGSGIRANANGQRFYAVINGTLYVGRRVSAGVDVGEVTVTPSVGVFHRDRPYGLFIRWCQVLSEYDKLPSAAAGAKDVIEAYQNARAILPRDAITITARVVGDQPPAYVSVDLSRLLNPPERTCRVQMFDDGLHDDGAAGDGVYGVTVPLTMESYRSDPADWRRPLPGEVALTVTAVGADAEQTKRVSGGVGIVALFTKLESRVLWQADAVRDWSAATGLAAGPAVDDGTPHPDKLFTRSLTFRVKDKPWTLPISHGGAPDNFFGYHSMVFWIRADRPGGKDVQLYLRDRPDDALPNDGPKTSLIKDGLVQGGAIDTTWRPVIVPIRKLIGAASDLQPQSVSEVNLAGEGGVEQGLWIRDILLIANEKDLQEALKPKAVAK